MNWSTWPESNTIQSWTEIGPGWTASWKRDGHAAAGSADTRHPVGAAPRGKIGAGFAGGVDVFVADSTFASDDSDEHCYDVD